jgi:hypothetical protein
MNGYKEVAKAIAKASGISSFRVRLFIKVTDGKALLVKGYSLTL